MRDLGCLTTVERLIEQAGPDASGDVEHQPMPIWSPLRPAHGNRSWERSDTLTSFEILDYNLGPLLISRSNGLDEHELFAIARNVRATESICRYRLGCNSIS